MTVEGEPGVDLAERAFAIARVFDAPREAVWKAWTEPSAWSAGGGRRASR